MRIVSLLPSATELVWALGLTPHLVGRTHECDFPPEVAAVPVVTRSLVPAGATSREVDALVSRSAHEHRSLYRLDREALARLQPDLILTQELCEVCAVAYDEVLEAARAIRLHLRVDHPPVGALPAAPDPLVISLEPMSLADVLDQLDIVGRATGTEERARAVKRQLQERLEAVRRRTAHLPRRERVLCLEWLDPPWCAGHWVPEMVELAGGHDALGQPGRPSRRITWEDIRAYRPELILLMPCGYTAHRAAAEYRELLACGALPPWWQDLPAVRQGQVFAVDANACFSRPGPRVVHGVEILAEILHPDDFGTHARGKGWVAV